MAAIPSGSTLQQLVVPAQINPMQGVANLDPMGNMSQGIDFAGQFARLGQLKDKLALEDITRKAEAAKQKAMEAEADLMHKNLSTQYAALAQQQQNALVQAQTQGAQIGALRDVVVGAPGAPGTAALDANTSAIQSGTQNYMARLYGQSIAGALASGQPTSPAAVATGAAAAAPGVTPTQSNDKFYEVNSPVPINIYRDSIRQQLVTRKLLAKEAPIVTPDEVDKAAGLVTKPETFIGDDNRTYGVDVTYGPNGVRFARSAPVPKDISPERKVELGRSGDLADIAPALKLATEASVLLNSYIDAGSGGPLQSLAQVGANTEPTGLLKSGVRIIGQKLENSATNAIEAKLAALRSVFNSSPRAAELKGFADLIPPNVDLSNPDKMKQTLGSLTQALNDRVATLQSNAASQAITAGGINGGAAKPAPVSDGKIGYLNGHQYRFNSSTQQWVLSQ